jgi:predicted ArsR family transcriptional regulator
MNIEKLKDYLILIQALIRNDFIPISKVSPKIKTIEYHGILNNLKGWANKGYIEMKNLESNEKRLGGPKKKFRLSKKGIEFTKELTEMLMDALGIQKIESINEEFAFNDGQLKEERIQDFLLEISDDLLEIVKDNDVLEQLQQILMKRLHNF